MKHLAILLMSLSLLACDGIALEQVEALMDEFPQLTQELAEAILAGDCTGIPEDSDLPCLPTEQQ